jgi:hypothetical protein
MPPDLEILGEYGAFGYVADRDPAFDTEETLNYYDRLDFDYRVSVDYIILPQFANDHHHRAPHPDHHPHRSPHRRLTRRGVAVQPRFHQLRNFTPL